MKRLTAITLILFCILASCKRDDSPAGVPVYEPVYATGFAIDSLAPGVTRIATLSPWVTNDAAAKSQLTLVEEGAEWADEGNVLRGVPKRIVAMSSTNVAMLDALGLTDCLAGVSGKKYIHNPKVRNAGIADIPQAENVDYEQLVRLAPDLVMLYGVDGSSPMEARLAELKIPYIYIGDYNEEHPLGKAEWVVVIAHIMGVRNVGAALYKPIIDHYTSIAQQVKNNGGQPVNVMLNTPYADVWTLPKSNSYMMQLIADAGGKPTFKPEKNRLTIIDMEQAYTYLENSDLWLNPGMANTLAEVEAMAPKCKKTNPFRNGNIYNSNKRVTADGGNDFFEGAVMQPDVVLADLAHIFNPDIFPNYETVYYHRLK